VSRLGRSRAAFFDVLAPPSTETLSAWADRRRVLAASGSAEPGLYRTARVPALREIQDAIGDPTVEQVVIMKSAQAGITEILVNAMLRTIDVAPTPTLYVMPSLEMASALMRTRIRPALEQMPELAAKVRSRTIMHVDVDGAPIEVVGGRSSSALSSRAIGQLFGDELDRLEHDLDGEGDPWTLAMARTATFAARTIVAVSTPTIAGASRIESLYLASDQRRLYVACPACGERIVPTLAQLVEQATGVVWQCPACFHAVDEAGRMALVASGEWRPSVASPVRGYHVWTFYSPWVSMAEILKKRAEAATSPELAQTFHNLVLGEPWSPPAMTSRCRTSSRSAKTSATACPSASGSSRSAWIARTISSSG
jgi:phage terminase large subunit GpA-like protein